MWRPTGKHEASERRHGTRWAGGNAELPALCIQAGDEPGHVLDQDEVAGLRTSAQDHGQGDEPDAHKGHQQGAEEKAPAVAGGSPQVGVGLGAGVARKRPPPSWVMEASVTHPP